MTSAALPFIQATSAIRREYAEGCSSWRNVSVCPRLSPLTETEFFDGFAAGDDGAGAASFPAGAAEAAALNASVAITPNATPRTHRRSRRVVEREFTCELLARTM